MTEQITAKTHAAWNDIKHLNTFSRHAPTNITGGDYNQVIMLPHAAVRVPRDPAPIGRASVEYETEITLTLGKAATPPPLAIPRFIEAYYDYVGGPNYSVVTRLPGNVLQQQEVKKLSASEKANMGRKIGAFVAWYASVLDIEECKNLMRETQAEVPNRLNLVNTCARLALTAYDIDSVFAGVLVMNRRQRAAYAAEGMLQPTIIGHDDLRPGNLTYVPDVTGQSLHGVFDFGNTQPSTPERELRHAACLGKEVLEPAIESYEAVTGDCLSRGLIDFWATAQASTVLALSLAAGNEAGALSGRAGMQELYPHYDWSRAFLTL